MSNFTVEMLYLQSADAGCWVCRHLNSALSTLKKNETLFCTFVWWDSGNDLGTARVICKLLFSGVMILEQDGGAMALFGSH